MSGRDREDEKARELRLLAQDRLLQGGLLEFLPDAEDVQSDLSFYIPRGPIDWKAAQLKEMPWNRYFWFQDQYMSLDRSVRPAAWAESDKPEVVVERPGIFSVNKIRNNVIAQFRLRREWPAISRTVLVVRVGDEHWIHDLPTQNSTELSLYFDLGTESDLRIRFHAAREALIRSPDAAVSFEFVLSTDASARPRKRR